MLGLDLDRSSCPLPYNDFSNFMDSLSYTVRWILCLKGLQVGLATPFFSILFDTIYFRLESVEDLALLFDSFKLKYLLLTTEQCSLRPEEEEDDDVTAIKYGSALTKIKSLTTKMKLF